MSDSTDSGSAWRTPGDDFWRTEDLFRWLDERLGKNDHGFHSDHREGHAGESYELHFDDHTIIPELLKFYGMMKLVVGAHGVLYHRKGHHDPLRRWADELLAIKPFKLVAVALANKLARVAFAIMRQGTVYSRVSA